MKAVLADAIVLFNRLTDPVTKLVATHRATIGRLLVLASVLSLPLVFAGPLIEPTGSAAFALLWLVLLIPVFSKVFGLRLFSVMMGLRKEIGILMGTLAVVHSAIYFVAPAMRWPVFSLLDAEFWIGRDGVTYLAFGFVATVFALLLLVTSNAASMKLMGHKKWKLLHRTAYLVLVFTVLHVVVLEYSKHGKFEFWPILVLVAYFVGKTLEWKGVTFAKKAA